MTQTLNRQTETQIQTLGSYVGIYIIQTCCWIQFTRSRSAVTSCSWPHNDQSASR